jgi:hypothetical protein
MVVPWTTRSAQKHRSNWRRASWLSSGASPSSRRRSRNLRRELRPSGSRRRTTSPGPPQIPACRRRGRRTGRRRHGPRPNTGLAASGLRHRDLLVWPPVPAGSRFAGRPVERDRPPGGAVHRSPHGIRRRRHRGVPRRRRFDRPTGPARRRDTGRGRPRRIRNDLRTGHAVCRGGLVRSRDRSPPDAYRTAWTVCPARPIVKGGRSCRGRDLQAPADMARQTATACCGGRSPRRIVPAMPRKRRHTARRIWTRLLDEEAALVADVSVCLDG